MTSSIAKPDKLYKCIGFDRPYWPYWPYIFKEQKIRFATSMELLGGNDQQEFLHRWHSDSPAFQWLANQIQPRYDSLYSKTVVLSMGMSRQRRCWDEYCSRDGGVRYEFSFQEPVDGSSDVDSKVVAYKDRKTFNLSEFFLQNNIQKKIKTLFESQSPMTFPSQMAMWWWLQSSEPRDVTLEHISNEIPFVKTTDFKYEDEFRFVHLLEQFGPKSLKVKLENQKVEYSRIGLKLVRVCTSDVEKVKNSFGNSEVEICEVDFSD